MDMKINPTIIIEHRQQKAWSQQHLADVSGLSLRTIQRIENTGAGSQDSVKAIAMAFGLVPADLMVAEAPAELQDNMEGDISTVSPSNKPWLMAMGAALCCGLALIIWMTFGPPTNAANQPSSSPTMAPTTAQQQDIEQAALLWLTTVDEGNYVTSWQDSDPWVHQQVTSEQWDESVALARAQFGPLLNRSLSSMKLSDSLPGMPDGEYAMLLFVAHFENKSDAVETLPMSKASGQWRPIGYFIR